MTGQKHTKNGHKQVRNQGKAKKDRFVTLPKASLLALRHYWASHRHPNLLFPAGETSELRHSAKRVMDRGGLQKSFKVIVKDCGIRKPVTLHSLRHCYGARLVETDVNLRAIQHEMGHGFSGQKITQLFDTLSHSPMASDNR